MNPVKPMQPMNHLNPMSTASPPRLLLVSQIPYVGVMLKIISMCFFVKKNIEIIKKELTTTLSRGFKFVYLFPYLHHAMKEDVFTYVRILG